MTPWIPFVDMAVITLYFILALQWRRNERDGVSNHRRLDCLPNSFCSGADQRKHQISASLAFVRGIRWWPVNSKRKRPVTLKMFPFDDVIMARSPQCNSIQTRWVQLELCSNDLQLIAKWLGTSFAAPAMLMFVPSQWETALLCNDVSHLLGANMSDNSAVQRAKIFVERMNSSAVVTN